MVIVTAADDPRHGRGRPAPPTSCSSTSPTSTARRRRDDLFVPPPMTAGRDPDDVTVLAVARWRPSCGRSRPASTLPPVALDVVDDAAGVAATLESWSRQGAIDGFVVQPDVPPTSLDWLATEVMRLESRRPSGTLRERFGLPRPPNRYATTEAAL